MYKIYLNESDLLQSTHLPVISVINEGFNHGIIEYLKTLNNGVGFDFNSTGCCFWNDLDDYEKLKFSNKEFDGILAYAYCMEEVIVSFKDMFHYISIAFERFNGDEVVKSETLKLIEEFKKKYL